MKINAVKRASLATFGKKSAHPNFMLRGLGPKNQFSQSLGAFYCEYMCHRSFLWKNA